MAQKLPLINGKRVVINGRQVVYNTGLQLEPWGYVPPASNGYVQPGYVQSGYVSKSST